MSLRVLVLVAACLSSGTALKCYLCSSDDGGYCSDSEIWKGRIEPANCPLGMLNPSGLDMFDAIAQGLGATIDNVERSSGIEVPLACQKVYYSSPSGKGRVERKCVQHSEQACRFAGSELVNGRMDYCGLCSHDGCNSAGRLGGSYLWLLPLLALLRWR